MSDPDKLFGKYNDYALVALGFLLTTGLGSCLVSSLNTDVQVLVSSLNEEAQERGRDAVFLESDRRDATDFFRSISFDMEHRLELVRQILYWHGFADVVDDDALSDLESRWGDYRAFLIQWNSRLDLNHALALRFFGDGVWSDFSDIHFGLRQLGENLEKNAALREARRTHMRADVTTLRAEADAVDSSIYKLDVCMIDLIIAGKIGRDVIGTGASQESQTCNQSVSRAAFPAERTP